MTTIFLNEEELIKIKNGEIITRNVVQRDIKVDEQIEIRFG